LKYVRFLEDNTPVFGLLEGDTVIKVEGDIFSDYQLSSSRYNLKDVTLLAPIVPGKFLGIGLNYKKHAEEVNRPLPEEPMIFMVSQSSIISTGEEIHLANAAHRTDFEGELAIVIGKTAKSVSIEEALNYVFGYTCCNDISDRILQKRDVQYVRAKSYDTYKPLGPVIETAIDPNQAPIRVRVNGQIRQDSNTNDMIFSAAEIISTISQVMTLDPGDVIITGTPSGVGPLQPGDIVEIEIEGIGTLTNKVSDKA
jgi:2-keto-4-pentenoate hydratase/2-oxohepta-3-ene-1,7-dioic acid hydratase in catechol pathway